MHCIYTDLGGKVSSDNSNFDKRIKKYIEYKFELQSRLTPGDITQRLSNRTLKNQALAMVFTNKDFIGRIDGDCFSIIDSSFPLPYGAACILNGTITPTSAIILSTTLHRAFRMFFRVWLIGMALLFMAFWIIDSAEINELLAFIIGMPIVAFLFRLFLHGMYLLARNHGLNKMKKILDVME